MSILTYKELVMSFIYLIVPMPRKPLGNEIIVVSYCAALSELKLTLNLCRLSDRLAASAGNSPTSSVA